MLGRVSFPVWSHSKDAKSVASVQLVREGVKNSGNHRGSLYTSSADDPCRCSLHCQVRSRVCCLEAVVLKQQTSQLAKCASQWCPPHTHNYPMIGMCGQRSNCD
jgi:hypothetical protein